MRETISTAIDGTEYKVRQLGGKTASAIAHRCVRGVLALQDLPPEDFAYLRDTLADSTQIGVVDKAGDGRTNWVSLNTVYDEHFAGPSGNAAQIKWLAFAWEANFGPFSDVVPSIMRFLKGLSLSGSAKASTGSAGGSSSPSA